jgi:hypothetical protein
MIGCGRICRTLIVAGMMMPALAAHAQNFGEKIRQPSGPPVENHPKVDEKAYKAALDRIPPPKQPYDPWGNARPAEPVKPAKTSN